MAILQDKRIVLGVTGGIAAYKSIDLASKLVQAGARVDAILTESARQFVTPLPFEAITKRRVHSGVFEGWSETEKGHISLAEEAELIIVAPATANSIARLALGLADDMLTVTHLAAAPRGTPIVIAPAMEHHMYLHPATQQHLETLRSRGAVVVDPDHGRLASGAIGIGRLPTTERLIAAIEGALSRGGPLWKKRVVVTTGATQEAIDPIRLLTNRSSGRMGYALAHAALQAGADVTLITTPTALPPVIGATTVPVTSAIDMRDAVATHAAGADALIMAAAVADYRPASVAEDKIKKSDDDLVIQLVRNPDILATVETPGTIRVGFAAETTNHEAYARDKLARKNLDFIVLNDARAAMGADSNAVTLFFRDGRSESLGEASKAAVAEQIMQRVADLVVGKPD